VTAPAFDERRRLRVVPRRGEPRWQTEQRESFANDLDADEADVDEVEPPRNLSNPHGSADWSVPR
jgi:hypothetical protein